MASGLASGASWASMPKRVEPTQRRIAMVVSCVVMAIVSFVVYSALGAGVAWSRGRAGSAEGTGADDVETGTSTTPPPTLKALLRSPLGPFAVLRGIGLGVAVLPGFTWFPAHAAWVAISALIVMRPPTRQALVVGLQRSLGTGVGVIVAVALAGVIGENTLGLIVLFVASAFLMMAVREVNYALFAVFVTAVVVYSQRILRADAAESGSDRLVATMRKRSRAAFQAVSTKARSRTSVDAVVRVT